MNLKTLYFSLLVVLFAVMSRISLGLSQIRFGSLDCKGTTVLSQYGSCKCSSHVICTCMYNCSLTLSMYGLSLYGLYVLYAKFTFIEHGAKN